MGDTGGFSVRSFNGQILQAAPVSTKQRAWDLESMIKYVRLLDNSCGVCAVLSPPDLSFPGLRRGWAFFTTVPLRQSDCDKSIVLACFNGGGGVGWRTTLVLKSGELCPTHC